MRIVGPIALCSLFGVIALSGHAADVCEHGKCQGDLRSPGGNALFSYITTSRIYYKSNVTVYETCVENQSGRVMEFNWFIPGPNTFVPDGYSCSNPRPKLTHADSPTYAGCLYYGNNWVRDHATFFPHVDDDAKIAAEKNDPQCKVIPTKVAGSTSDPSRATAISALTEGITVTLGAFAPTDLKNEDQTLAYIRAVVSLTRDPKDDEKYIHSMSVTSSSFRGSKPDFESLKLLPEKNEVEDFKKSIPEGYIQLTKELNISAELQLPNSPVLELDPFQCCGPR